MVEEIKTDCILCVWGCGINAYVEDGKLIKVTGMTEHPLNEGVICPKGISLPEYIYSPERLKYPMKKVTNGFERISWDEALNTISSKLKQIKDEYDAHALAIYCGSIGVENYELTSFAHRFRGAFGTPNFLSAESNCYRSRILSHQLTFGAFFLEEPEKAKCVILWGHDPENSKLLLASKLRKAINKGLQLISINPKRIQLAKKGLHIPIRPGTDCALALAMINVIIDEDLYDKEFVEKHTHGFDQLREHIKQYPPEKVAEITWISADDIKKIARIFANSKPACVVPGFCTMEQHINGLQNGRVLAILQTITGNIDIPGGWVKCPFPRITNLDIETEEEPIGASQHPLFYRLWGRKADFGQAMYLPDAVIDEKPYPIKAMIVTGGNPLITLPDYERIKETFEKLDFMVVMDLFMTDTAEMADIVLPACSFVERAGIGYINAVTSGIPHLSVRKKLIEPLWECWPDWKFWCELGRRMGYADLFPWQTDDEIVEQWLEPSGFTIEQLTVEHPEGVIIAPKKYNMGIKGEFRTPSKKIELYSDTMAEYGYDPIPVFVEPSQSTVSNPELAREYPLILTTGQRYIQYTHSQFRNVQALHKAAPEPLAEIHPDTAGEYGITNGDMISIETRKGKIKMKARTTEDMVQGVVGIPHGWSEANANVLTELEPHDPVTGYTELKALLCRIKPAL